MGCVADQHRPGCCDGLRHEPGQVKATRDSQQRLGVQASGHHGIHGLEQEGLWQPGEMTDTLWIGHIGAARTLCAQGQDAKYTFLEEALVGHHAKVCTTAQREDQGVLWQAASAHRQGEHASHAGIGAIGTHQQGGGEGRAVIPQMQGDARATRESARKPRPITDLHARSLQGLLQGTAQRGLAHHPAQGIQTQRPGMQHGAARPTMLGDMNAGHGDGITAECIPCPYGTKGLHTAP